MRNIADIADYITAGRATATLVNNESGNHFTYAVTRAKETGTRQPRDARYFVSLLNGPNNELDYVYIGMLFVSDAGVWNFRLTRGSKVSATSEGFKAFTWLTAKVNHQQDLPEKVELLHDGRCGKCRRKLTTPESIRSGLGPVCAEKVA